MALYLPWQFPYHRLRFRGGGLRDLPVQHTLHKLKYHRRPWITLGWYYCDSPESGCEFYGGHHSVCDGRCHLLYGPEGVLVLTVSNRNEVYPTIGVVGYVVCSQAGYAIWK